jgi:cytochrome c oxidase subunit 3
MAQGLKYYRNRIHPHQFALYAAMASILMMFASLTSAYVVRQAVGNWHEYTLPGIFYYSTAVLLLSSVTLHLSFSAYKKGKKEAYRSFLLIAMCLGLTFVVMQYYGWQALYSIGVPLDGNPSGSFFYVISGVHAAHVLGGIAALCVALIHALSLKFEVSEKRKNRFALVVQYWHFVDILWLYLFVFILLAQ